MDQKIINLFDRYTHGGMSRRDFLDRLTLMAGSAAAATALLPVLENNYVKRPSCQRTIRASCLPTPRSRRASRAFLQSAGMHKANCRRCW